LDLLRFVRFEYLSADCISDFLSSLPDSIDRHLWKSISGRLIPQVPPISPSKSLKGVEFPLTEARSLDGIISFLTRNDKGNLQRFAAISSKSVWDDNPGYSACNVADLTSDWGFCSKNEPGQWICWDFHQMRVCPTHYTIRNCCLKSWVVESSLDGLNWTEIDRKTDNNDMLDIERASFAVSNSAECRFLRLTQTGANHDGNDLLCIEAFEFFGTLLE
jgi:hypothetical protein